jgi:hypothetical protein
MESVDVRPDPPTEDDLLACDTCGRTPDGLRTWHVTWDADARGHDVLRALCPDCARRELDD